VVALPFTLAENCCCSPCRTFAVAGVTVSPEFEVDPPEPDPEPDPDPDPEPDPDPDPEEDPDVDEDDLTAPVHPPATMQRTNRYASAACRRRDFKFDIEMPPEPAHRNISRCKDPPGGGAISETGLVEPMRMVDNAGRDSNWPEG
jgi:hypothetical protein